MGPRAQQKRVDVCSLMQVLASGIVVTLRLPESVAVLSSLRDCQSSHLPGWTREPTPLAREGVVLSDQQLMPTGLGSVYH